jgi:hypothetical protein
VVLAAPVDVAADDRPDAGRLPVVRWCSAEQRARPKWTMFQVDPDGGGVG